MSRVEKRIEADNKKKSYKKFFKLTFILFMICISTLCVFEIDKHAMLMFGEVEKYNIEVFLTNMEKTISKSLEDVYEDLNKLNNLKLK